MFQIGDIVRITKRPGGLHPGWDFLIGHTARIDNVTVPDPPYTKFYDVIMLSINPGTSWCLTEDGIEHLDKVNWEKLLCQ